MTSGHNAEQQLINDWGLDPKFFSGLKLGMHPWQHDSFELHQAKRVKVVANEEAIEAIEMLGNARFGNSFISLVHALTVAQVLGVNEIFCPHESLKFSGQVGNIMVTQRTDESRNRLSGTFYYPHLLEPLLSLAGVSHWWESQFASNPQVFALYGIELNQAELGENVLLIHLRSGDVFESSHPHPDYGQPPLAFYKRVIDNKEWERVFLIYENDSNPAVRGLKDHLNSKKLPYSVSSSDVSTDIQLLLSGKHLVMSRGTFLWPVVVASRNLESVFIFGQSSTWSPNHLQAWPLRQEHEFVIVADKISIYEKLVLNRWQNNPFQRHLMTWYPKSWLSEAVPAGKFRVWKNRP